MAIIAVIIIIAIMAWFSSLPDDNSHSNNSNWRPFDNNPHDNFGSSNSRYNEEHFEEDDSFYDRHGNEHIVDEDMYCEECDDYHDFD